MVPLCSSFTTLQGVTLCRKDIPQPLSNESGINKTGMARIWPGLEPFFRQKFWKPLRCSLPARQQPAENNLVEDRSYKSATLKQNGGTQFQAGRAASCRRANVAPIRQSRPDSGLGVEAKILETFKVIPSLLGSSTWTTMRRS
jgi:hypothetical protein